METLKSTGTDDMLKHDIEKWVDKYNEPNTNNVTTAILAAVIYVANELLVQKAVYYRGHAMSSWSHTMTITHT